MKRTLGILFFLFTSLAVHGTQRSVPTVSLYSSAAYSHGALFLPRPQANQPAGSCDNTILVPVFIDNEYDSALTAFSITLRYDTTFLVPTGYSMYNEAYAKNRIALAQHFFITLSGQNDAGSHKRLVVNGYADNIAYALKKTVFYDSTSGQRDPFRSVMDTSKVLVWIRFAVKGSYVEPITLVVNQDTLKILDTVYWNLSLPGKRGTNSPAGTGALLVQRTALPLVTVTGNDIVKKDSATFEMNVEVDSGSVAMSAISKLIRYTTALQNSFLGPVHVESNEDWLMIGRDTVPGVPFEGSRMVDGEALLTTALESDTGLLRIMVKTKGLIAGEHRAELTFTSNCAMITPVKLIVTCSVDRFANEGQRAPCASNGFKIFLNTTNVNPRYDSLTFGTGSGASRGMDKLFGEHEEASAQQGFSPRWFPVTEVQDGASKRGFRGAKRDIRDLNESITLHYLCRLGNINPAQYPIVLRWKPCYFPEGSVMRIHDTAGGNYFSAPMTENDTTISISSFGNLNSFYIDYTPPRSGIKKTITLNAWNMLSLTALHQNSSFKEIYKNADSLAGALYYRGSSYVRDSIVQFGRAYFLHYGSTISQHDYVEDDGIYKVELTIADSVILRHGWNMIGGLSVPVEAKKIILAGNDTSHILSNCFEYSPEAGYIPSATITPGKGYFVKISGDAFYTVKADGMMSTPSGNETIAEESTRLTVSDADGKKSTLLLLRQSSEKSFELPPTMPGAFDVRFGEGTYASSSDEHSIIVQGARYPLVFTLDGVGDDHYELLGNNNMIGTFDEQHQTLHEAKESNGTFILRRLTQAVSISFGSVMPNPASDRITTIVEVPRAMNVRFSLTDALGREVRSRSLEIREHISHLVSFDVLDLPAGMYFLRMNAQGSSLMQSFILAK